MKYIWAILGGALIFISACASTSSDYRNNTSLTEQRASSRELDMQIDALANQISSSQPDQNVKKIAVIEFANLDGNVTGLGKYLAEELTTRLFRTGRFHIVERRLMNTMMEEQKLGATGLIDEKTASKFGRILGADVLMTGTIAELNTGIKLNARLIAVETGVVFAVASVNLPISTEVEKLLGRKLNAAASPDPERFDGTWDVGIVCPPKEGGLGYTIQLSALVKDGVLRGQYGTEGIAPCLTLDGKINADGSAIIRANGLTGDPKYNMRSAQKGMAYSYHIDANFSANRGMGTRIEARSCNVLFFRQ
jgi:TolB-like protein